MVETFSLCGPWTLEEALGQREIPAQVPGSVLHDLLENGLIPDPFRGKTNTTPGICLTGTMPIPAASSSAPPSWPGSM